MKLEIQGISVVISTFNRSDLLKNCINSLLEQSLKDYEIIIVNDASTDETKNYLESFNHPKIKVIQNEKNIGLSSSRNIGIGKAKYDLIAFTDDDCIADKNWLRVIWESFKTEAFAFASGQTFLVSREFKGYFPERVVTNIDAKWPKGNNLIYRKTVFEQAGYFDPSMDYYSNDDTEMAIRAVSNNFRFQSLSKAVVYHQKTKWTKQSLLKSARNPSVWVMLKKRFPNHYLFFNPPVKFRIFIHGEDYLYILLMPVLLPILLIRFILHGQRDFVLFFTKWPWYPFLRRFYVFREVLRNKIFMM
jgi:glycosyltransferase involved in cell wall biosynthesis